MERTEPRVSAWLSQGWSTYRNNSIPLITGGALAYVLGLAALIPRLGFLVTIVISAPIGAGWALLCLKAARSENPAALDVFSGFGRFVTAWLTLFFVTLICAAGLLLLIVPGIIWSLKYSLSLYAVMDDKADSGWRAAMRRSGEITKGFRWRLFGLFLLFGLLSLSAHPFIWGLQSLITGRSALGKISVSPTTLLGIGLPLLALYIWLIVPWCGATVGVVYQQLSSERREHEAAGQNLST